MQLYISTPLLPLTRKSDTKIEWQRSRVKRICTFDIYKSSQLKTT